MKKELVVCLAVAVWVITSSILNIPPLSYVIDLNEYVKASWIVSKEYEPPFGHAELLTLNAFCAKLKIPIKEALGELQKRGVRVPSTKQSVAEIAKNNEMKPMNLYALISYLEPQLASPAGTSAMTAEMVEEKFTGSGIGRKTIDELATQMKLDLPRIQQRLAKMSIEVTGEETLKQVAGKASLTPIELLKGILVEGYQPKK